MDSSKLKLVREWIVKILGPFLLLPLATLPLDIGTGIFWLFGLIFFLIALSTAIKSIILGPTIKNLINPILVMSIVALSMLNSGVGVKTPINFPADPKVSITRDGVILIHGKGYGQLLALIPVQSNRSIKWTCLGGSAKDVPAACRAQ